MPEPNPNPTAGAEILIDGTKLPQELMSQLLDVEVRDNLLKPDTAVVRLRDPDGTVIDHDMLEVGKAIEVKLSAAAETTVKPLFKGEVVALEPEFTEHDCVVAIRAYDRAHRLHAKRVSRTFQQQTAADMVKTVGSQAGLSVGRIESTSVVHEFFQQSMETDWEFCWRLAAMHNFEFVVEDREFHFRERETGSPAATLTWGENLLGFRPRMSGVGQPKEVTVANLDPKTKQLSNGRASTPRLAAQSPGANGRNKVVADLAGGSVTVADRVAGNQSEANVTAQSVLDRIASTFVEAEGKAVGNPLLRAGATVSIAKVGKRFSGTYVLTQSTHRFRGGERYTTAFVISGRTGHSFADLLQSSQKASWSNQLVVGIVTNNKDPENMGRVRVKFPNLGDTIEGWWARVATINAGQERGLFMMPEVNDEVVVAFEHGDTRRPIVLGSVFGGKAKLPPDLQDSKNNPPKAAFGVKSDDKAHIESKQAMLLRSDEKLTVEVRRAAQGGTGDFLLDAQGNIEQKAAQNIKATANASFEVDAKSSVTIKGTGSVTVETSGALRLKGSTVDIQASGPVNVKGAIINLG
jgi:phage protein D/phage baseplate assembly protein gpV